MTDTVEIAVTINGRVHRLAVSPRRVLADVLREDSQLLGCADKRLAASFTRRRFGSKGCQRSVRPFACSVVIPSCRPLLSITSFPSATSPILWSGPTPIRDAASYGCPSFAAPTGDRPVAADGSLRFRHEPFGRDLALAPGGASRPLA